MRGEMPSVTSTDCNVARPTGWPDRWINHRRGVGPEGQKQYTIWDAYQHADLVTYPSTYEGFGNAFLEAIYYKKPILCNRYGIYRTDIEPCGFKVILMDGFLTDDVVAQVRRVLDDKDYASDLTNGRLRRFSAETSGGNGFGQTLQPSWRRGLVRQRRDSTLAPPQRVLGGCYY